MVVVGLSRGWGGGVPWREGLVGDLVSLSRVDLNYRDSGGPGDGPGPRRHRAARTYVTGYHSVRYQYGLYGIMGYHRILL